VGALAITRVAGFSGRPWDLNFFLTQSKTDLVRVLKTPPWTGLLPPFGSGSGVCVRCRHERRPSNGNGQSHAIDGSVRGQAPQRAESNLTPGISSGPSSDMWAVILTSNRSRSD